MFHLLNLITWCHCRYDWVSNSILIIVLSFLRAMSNHICWTTFACLCVSFISWMSWKLSWWLMSMTISWNRMMSWRRWLILYFFFFFIFIIVIFWCLISSYSSWHHSRVSSMTSWGPIKVIPSIHLAEIIILLNLNIILAVSSTPSSYFVLIIIFELCFFSFLDMYWNCSFVYLLLWPLSLSLEILQYLSLQI